jgi:hypothetical protein
MVSRLSHLWAVRRNEVYFFACEFSQTSIISYVVDKFDDKREHLFSLFQYTIKSMMPREETSPFVHRLDLVAKLFTKISAEVDALSRFVAAVKIYVNKPHVVNRRIVDSAELYSNASQSSLKVDGSVGLVVVERRLYPRSSSLRGVDDVGEMVIKGSFRLES